MRKSCVNSPPIPRVSSRRVIAKEELRKKEIFEEFIKTGTLSDESQKFCDKLDWYPVDELELKEEYIKKLKKIEKGPHIKIALEKLDKLL